MQDIEELSGKLDNDTIYIDESEFGGELNKMYDPMLDEYDSRYKYCGVLINNVQVGNIVLQERANDVLYIDDIYLYERFRNKGYGTKIIKFLIQELKPKSILLDAVPDAVEFYKKLGFRQISKEENKHGCFRMRLNIKENIIETLSKYDSPEKLFKALPKFVYHSTTKDKLESIEKNGLKNFWVGCDVNECTEYVKMNHNVEWEDIITFEIPKKMLDVKSCDFTADVGDGWSDEWTYTFIYKGTIDVRNLGIYEESGQVQYQIWDTQNMKEFTEGLENKNGVLVMELDKGKTYLYHRSPEKFKEFDFSKCRSGQGGTRDIDGMWFFLDDNFFFSKGFDYLGKWKYRVQVDISKFPNFNKRRLFNANNIVAFCEKYIPDWVENGKIIEVQKGYVKEKLKSQSGNLRLINIAAEKNNKKPREIVVDMGYDGLILQGNEVVVCNPDAIHNVEIVNETLGEQVNSQIVLVYDASRYNNDIKFIPGVIVKIKGNEQQVEEVCNMILDGKKDQLPKYAKILLDLESYYEDTEYEQHIINQQSGKSVEILSVKYDKDNEPVSDYIIGNYKVDKIFTRSKTMSESKLGRFSGKPLTESVEPQSKVDWTNVFESFLDITEFSVHKSTDEDGNPCYVLRDHQGGNLGDIESDTFQNAEEIIERMGVYVDDYFIEPIIDNLAQYDIDCPESADEIIKLIRSEQFKNDYPELYKEYNEPHSDIQILELVAEHGEDVDLERVATELDDDNELGAGAFELVCTNDKGEEIKYNTPIAIKCSKELADKLITYMNKYPGRVGTTWRAERMSYIPTIGQKYDVIDAEGVEEWIIKIRAENGENITNESVETKGNKVPRDATKLKLTAKQESSAHKPGDTTVIVKDEFGRWTDGKYQYLIAHIRNSEYYDVEVLETKKVNESLEQDEENHSVEVLSRDNIDTIRPGDVLVSKSDAWVVSQISKEGFAERPSYSITIRDVKDGRPVYSQKGSSLYGLKIERAKDTQREIDPKYITGKGLIDCTYKRERKVVEHTGYDHYGPKDMEEFNGPAFIQYDGGPGNIQVLMKAQNHRYYWENSANVGEPYVFDTFQDALKVQEKYGGEILSYNEIYKHKEESLEENSNSQRTLMFTQIADSRFDKDLENTINQYKSDIISKLSEIDGVKVHTDKIRDVEFEDGTKQLRQDYFVQKQNNKVSWNDIYAIINSVNARPYKFIKNFVMPTNESLTENQEDTEKKLEQPKQVYSAYKINDNTYRLETDWVKTIRQAHSVYLKVKEELKSIFGIGNISVTYVRNEYRDNDAELHCVLEVTLMNDAKECYNPQYEKVEEDYKLSTGTRVKVFSDYDKAKEYAEANGYIESEYGDFDNEYSYCYWNKSGDRNQDEEVACFYKFVDGKPVALDDKDIEILNRREELGIGVEIDQEDYIYLFPELNQSDLNALWRYQLKFLGKNFFDGQVNYVVKGTEKDLNDYAHNYLDYELHPDYLYKEKDFAGDIVSGNKWFGILNHSEMTDINVLLIGKDKDEVLSHWDDLIEITESQPDETEDSEQHYMNKVEPLIKQLKEKGILTVNDEYDNLIRLDDNHFDYEGQEVEIVKQKSTRF